MSPIEQTESALRLQQRHLVTRRQDLALAQKAGRETTEIEHHILVAERKIYIAEQLILRLKREARR